MALMRIKPLRDACNMTQAQLACNMGVTQTVVCNWEHEVALPRTRQLPDLARVLGCSIDDLFIRDDGQLCPM